MAEITYNDVRILIRNDTTQNWTSENPVLMKGELGIEKLANGSYMMKVGDGTSQWSSLKYVGSPVEVKTTAPTTTDSNYNIGTMWVNTTNDKAYIIYDNTASAAVWKQIVTPEELSDLGAGDMLKSQFATNAKAEQGYVDKAIMADSATEATHATNADNATNAENAAEATHAASADSATTATEAGKLSTGRTISITGDATGSTAQPFDGTGDAAINIVLKNSGVTAGTYTKLTVNAKGIVTAAENLSATDIPAITLSKVSDAGTAASKDVGTTEGTIPILGPDGKLDDSVIPAIAISDVYEANSEEAMLALSKAQVGDICVRSDVNKTYVLKAEPYSTLGNWVELKTPTDTVLSVNGKTGAVTLTTSDITEGTNLYYTEERATQNFNTNIAKTASTSLSDSSTLVRTTDTLVLNCGNA